MEFVSLPKHAASARPGHGRANERRSPDNGDGYNCPHSCPHNCAHNCAHSHQ
jgi:hypothetical protein